MTDLVADRTEIDNLNSSALAALSGKSIEVSKAAITMKSQLSTLFGAWELLSVDDFIPLKAEVSKNVAIIGSSAEKTAVILISSSRYPNQNYFAATAACRKHNYTYQLSLTTPAIIESLAEVDRGDSELSDDENVKLLNGLITEAQNIGAADIFIDIDEGDNFKASFEIDTDKVDFQDYTRAQVTGMMRYFYQQVADQETLQDPIFDMESSQFATGDGIWNGKKLRLRYQCKKAYPEGTDFAIRLLNMEADEGFNSIDDLMVSRDQQALIRKVITGEKGAIILIGQTASGKTTTIKVLLTEMLNRKNGLIIRSIESPPEYIIPGVRQYVVRESRDDDESSFDEASKEVLRMNPHLIFMGETRSKATAGFLRKVIDSGHGALTTLHATGTYGAFSRLESEGYRRDVLAQDGNINALIYQQRLPKTCTHCGISHNDFVEKYSETNGDESKTIRRLKLLNSDLSDVVHVNRTGCTHCYSRGISGTIITMELVTPDSKCLESARKEDERGFNQAWVDVCKTNNFGDAVETHTYHALRLMLEGVVSPERYEEKYGEINLVGLEQRCRAWRVGDDFHAIANQE